MIKSREEMTELDFDDPMDWVYEVRRRISEKYGHDLKRYFDALRQRRAVDEANGIHYVKLPIVRREPAVV